MEGGGEGGFIRVYLPILFIRIYPFHIPKDAGKINEIMLTLTLSTSKNVVAFIYYY